MLALPVSGAVVHRLGPRRTIAICALAAGSALTGVGSASAVPVLVLSLFGVGMSSSTWDVAMNVAAARVEQRLGRPIMPRFHAAFSLGTVAGAGGGAVAAATGLPVAVHLPVAGALGAATALAALTRFLPEREADQQATDRPVAADPSAQPVAVETNPGSGTLAAWREPRTLGIGLMVLGMAFCEGTANDWLAVGVVDGYHVDHAVGATAFGVFVAAMTVGRMAGPAAIARFGRVLVLRAGAGLVMAGAGLVVGGAALREVVGPFGTAVALTVAGVGALAWGCGAALGFPIGMSAAADDPVRAAARISVVASIGYTAFLAGPPLLGLLGDRVGTLHAQLGVLVAVAVTLLTAGVTRAPTARPIPRVGAVTVSVGAVTDTSSATPSTSLHGDRSDPAGAGSVHLSDVTTFRVGGLASRYVVATTSDAVIDAVSAADAVAEPVLILGGGSNLLVSDAGFQGTVIHIATSGVQLEDVDSRSGATVRVAAGEEWDGFVAAAVERGWVGVEGLSGIPGSTGATPLQNVGAYGQEVAETVVTVRTWDRQQGRVRTLANADCEFGYRRSRLREERLAGAPRFVVLEVTFRLAVSDRSVPIRYAELARTLGVEVGGRVPPAAVREAVLELRRGKGMVLDLDDHDTWSAGSFFTNPVLDVDSASQLPDEAPRWPTADGLVKLSAAWLIEHAGFGRGFGLPGPAALSTKHTLALTNRGDARAEDLLRLAREVRDGVRAAFGVELMPEPVLVGCRL